MKLIYGVLLLSLLMSSCSLFDKDNDIKVDLPTTVQNFIDSNFSDFVIDEAESDTLCTGEEVYEVELEKNGDKKDEEEIELTFDMEGNLLFTEREINTDALPDAVKNSIASNYGDYKLKEAEELEMADGTFQYEVELKKDGKELDVLFNSEGTVICEEQGD